MNIRSHCKRWQARNLQCRDDLRVQAWPDSLRIHPVVVAPTARWLRRMLPKRFSYDSIRHSQSLDQVELYGALAVILLWASEESDLQVEKMLGTPMRHAGLGLQKIDPHSFASGTLDRRLPDGWIKQGTWKIVCAFSGLLKSSLPGRFGKTSRERTSERVGRNFAR